MDMRRSKILRKARLHDTIRLSLTTATTGAARSVPWLADFCQNKKESET